MSVALDAQLTVGTATGIGEYVSGLAQALRRRRIDVIELLEPSLDPWRFDRRVMWDQLLLPRRARATSAKLLHCAAGTMPLRAGMPVVVTVHDLAWHQAQAHAPLYARYYFGPFSLHRYRDAARIVVDSSFSRSELLQFTDLDAARVEVVFPGVSNDFCRLQRESGDGRTILAVGTVERRKNLEVLVRALPRVTGARLIAIGPHTPYARDCMELAQQLHVADRVSMPGYVPRRDLLNWYQTCAVAAVPSRYEGFGYAAAQALCAGAPCIVSNCGSLPEVSGNAAPLLDADDAEAWAAALQAALSGTRDAHAAQGRPAALARFSWDASAARIEAVYASVNR